MLIVDVNALGLVDALDLAHEILHNAAHALQLKHLVRIERAFSQAVARLDFLAHLNLEVASVRNQVGLAKLDDLDARVLDLASQLLGKIGAGLDESLAVLRD